MVGLRRLRGLDGGAAQESIELSASGVERVLLRFAYAWVDQGAFVVFDELSNGMPDVLAGEFLVFVASSNDFTTKRPQVVSMPADGFARQTVSQQAEQERRKHLNDLLTHGDVGLVDLPGVRPAVYVRARLSQALCVLRGKNGCCFRAAHGC